MVPWSSGQDASLSRWNQGFDSPRHYQQRNRRACPVYFFVSPGGVEPERAEGSGGAFRAEHGRAARRPADLRQQICVTPLGTTNSTKPRPIGRGFVLPENVPEKKLKIVVFSGTKLYPSRLTGVSKLNSHRKRWKG